MAEDGVTTSGYGTDYAWQVRAVGYSLVGGFHLMPRIRLSLYCVK